MTKKEYYEKYKNNNIKTYIKYVLNEYKKAFIDFFGSIGLMIVSPSPTPAADLLPKEVECSP